MDHFVKKYTFWSKWPPEISLVASPWFKQKIQKGSTECLWCTWTYLLGITYWFWATSWNIFAKGPHFGQNGLRKSAWWRPPDSNKSSKIIKTNQQNVYEVHQCNYQGLFINLGLLGGSFCQKVYFLDKVNSGNHPDDVPLIQTKIQKLIKRFCRMFMKCINVIIRAYSLI